VFGTYQARVKRALERAAAPVFKKSGKPVMFRSELVAKKVEEVKEADDGDEAELQAFLAKDML
jgi:hypothetical protein